jgi:hypothetical protein
MSYMKPQDLRISHSWKCWCLESLDWERYVCLNAGSDNAKRVEEKEVESVPNHRTGTLTFLRQADFSSSMQSASSRGHRASHYLPMGIHGRILVTCHHDYFTLEVSHLRKFRILNMEDE